MTRRLMNAIVIGDLGPQLVSPINECQMPISIRAPWQLATSSKNNFIGKGGFCRCTGGESSRLLWRSDDCDLTALPAPEALQQQVANNPPSHVQRVAACPHVVVLRLRFIGSNLELTPSVM